MIKQIVSKHNELRNLVATGQAEGMGGELLPAATDMMLLKWDEDLAASAQM